VVTLGATTTTTIGGQLKDGLNPRIISNLIADSSNPIGFSSLSPADPNYAKKQLLKLQDNPTGRISPTSGAVTPLPYSNFMAQLGQFFDHGLDFVDKGGEGVINVKLLASDGLYGTTGGKATSMFASRSKTVTVNWGSGSTDALLTKMGVNLASQDTPSWDPVSTITTAPGTGGYVVRLVLNSSIIDIQVPNIQALVTEFNDLVPTTGVTVSAIPFPAIPGVTPPGSYQLTFTPARAESFNWQGNIPGVSFNTNPLTGSVRDLVDPSVLNAHFIFGDGRMHENIGLTQIHELFLNEHNRVLTELKASYGFTGEQPSGGWIWTDPLTNVTTNVTGEDLFQQAKLKFGAAARTAAGPAYSSYTTLAIQAAMSMLAACSIPMASATPAR